MTAAAARASSPRIDRAIERRWPLALAFTLLLLTAWQLSQAAGALPEYVLAPARIVGAVGEYAGDGLLTSLSASLERAAIGLCIGAGAGVLLGLLAGVVRSVRDFVELPVMFSYPLPKIALFPALAVWLGFEDRTRILVIAFACFYPAFINAQGGTASIDEKLMWLARNAGAGRIRTFAQVVAPAVLPRILAGLRISVALSFVLLFATETIGYSDGLGSDIKVAFEHGDFDRMYAATAVLAIAGILANGVVTAVSNRVNSRRSG